MPTAAPLQILLFRHTDDADVLRYEKAIVRAFQGGKEAGEYLATGEDLGIQLEVFSTAPGLDASRHSTAFCHTLTVVLLTARYWMNRAMPYGIGWRMLAIHEGIKRAARHAGDPDGRTHGR